MAATAEPSVYDPKPLDRGTLGTTATTTLYTAPAGEAGVKVERILLVNKTSTVRYVTMDHYNATDTTYICYQMDIPVDGSPVVLELGLYMAAGDEIRGGAEAASAIDCAIYGIELKD